MILIQKITDSKKDPQDVEIIVDRDGLISLMARLNFLVEGKTDHIDLLSKSWGGDLEDLSNAPGRDVINFLKVRVL